MFRKGKYQVSKKQKNIEVYNSVTSGLQHVYKEKLLPFEQEYQFHDFHSPALEDPDFEARPLVILIGQYSTGKTTFIRYLLEQDFPRIRIGFVVHAQCPLLHSLSISSGVCSFVQRFSKNS